MEYAYQALRLDERGFWGVRPKNLEEICELEFPSLLGVQKFTDGFNMQRFLSSGIPLTKNYDNEHLKPIAAYYAIERSRNTHNQISLLELASILEDTKMTGSPEYGL